MFLAVSLFLIAINVQAGFLLVISSALVAILIVSYAVPAISIRSVEVSRVMPAEAFEFEEIPVELRIKNNGWLPRFLLRLEDGFVGGAAHVVTWLPRGASRTIHYPARLNRRGVYKTAGLTLSCAAPFGIVRRQRKIEAHAGLTVYPVYVDLPSFPLLESQSVPYETLHDRRTKGAGYDYLGTREYRAGDSLRMVHWRSSARRGELVVKEYEEEASSPVSVIISHTEDYAVRIAASVARYVSLVGHPLQLFAADDTGFKSLTFPSFWQVLEWLAEIKTDQSYPAADLLKDAMPYLKPRSTLVVIALSKGSGWLENLPAIQAQRIRVISILVDETEAEEAGVAETDEMIGELKADRISVYRYRLGDDLKECLKGPLSFTSE